MDSKRVFIFSLSLTKGGAENQLAKLAIYLKTQRKVDVSIFYFVDQPNHFKDEFEKHGISTLFFKLKSFYGFKDFLFYIKKYRPSLVISFMFGANLIARLIKFIYNVPVVTSVRTSEISRKYYFFYRVSFKIDDYTVFNSYYALNKFVRKSLCVPDKSCLINNSIDVDFSGGKSKKANINFTLISVAHFRDAKDYVTLFKSISLLKKNNNINIRLFVLGHLYGQTWPLELVEKLNIGELVEIVGFTQNIKEYMDRSDALVLSSLWEGTPNAVLEGMANYLPIIASDVPSVRELIEKSNCGVLFEKKSVLDLKNKISFMKDLSATQRFTYGLRGREYVLKHYSPTKVFEKWWNIIEPFVVK